MASLASYYLVGDGLTDPMEKEEEIELLNGIFGQTAETEQLNAFEPHKYAMKLGRLREFLSKHADLPDDAPVLIERVEDYYFEKGGWTTVDFQFGGMADRQKFFEPHGTSRTKNMLIIHAHY